MNMLNSVRDQLRVLFSNPVFLSAVFSWMSAQFIKTVIKLFSGRVSSFQELISLMFWRTGGMPSSHSALVASLSTTIAYRSGLSSDIFILSGCFALVVIRDAVGVRRSSGVQSRVLNEMGTALAKKQLVSFRPVKEIQGHKPIEVFVGCLLGFFIGTAFSIL